MDWLETRIRRLEQLAGPLRTRTGEVERQRRATTQGLFYLGRQQVPEPPPDYTLTLTWNTGANTATHTLRYYPSPGPGINPFYATDILGNDATKWWDTHHERFFILIATASYTPGSGRIVPATGAPSLGVTYGYRNSIPFPYIISMTYSIFGVVTINVT